MGYQAFKLSEVEPIKEEYIGWHGWYWHEEAIASILARAFMDKYEKKAEALGWTRIKVSELTKTDAGQLTAGCHNTLYSVFVFVESAYQHPSAEEVYDAYKNTNAQFKAKEIVGGYQFYEIVGGYRFYKVW